MFPVTGMMSPYDPVAMSAGIPESGCRVTPVRSRVMLFALTFGGVAIRYVPSGTRSVIPSGVAAMAAVKAADASSTPPGTMPVAVTMPVRDGTRSVRAASRAPLVSDASCSMRAAVLRSTPLPGCPPASSPVFSSADAVAGAITAATSVPAAAAARYCRLVVASPPRPAVVSSRF
jgi:hypothetical protein